MATTIGQHSVASFTSPVNGTTPIDANTVRGNDNTLRVAYVDHDADPGIHVQSSTLASRPAAGTAGRKWITSDYPQKLWYDDGTDWHEVGGDAITVYCKATETIAKGDVVKVTGWNNGQSVAEIAKVSSATDTAFGVAEAAIANGSLGYVINTGILTDVATNSFSLGDILYPNTSGGFTATKPTSGTYQPCAYVLRSNATNGVLYVEFSAPRIVERSDNTASTIVLRDASGDFSAGTITATTLAGTLSTAAQPNVTSVGTLTSLTVSGDLTVDTSTLKVDSTNNRVGIGTATPAHRLDVAGSIASNGIELMTSDGSANYLKVGNTLYIQAASTILATIDNAGSVNFDSGTLYVDAANNRVGVGTASPAAAFEVKDGYIRSYHNSAGNLAGYGIEFSTDGGGTNTTIGSIIIEQNGASTRSGSLLFSTSNAGAPAVKMRLDASGNLGLGVTPSAWRSTQKAIQVANSSLTNNSNVLTGVYHNTYIDSSNVARYITSDYATGAYQLYGEHAWVTAPSGTAGNAITFTQAMTLDASGNLLVGTTTATNNLRLNEKLAVVHAGSGTYAGMSATGYSGTSVDARPVFDFNRSRGTTDGSMTKAESGDTLGSVIFRGADGTSFADSAMISAQVDGATGASDMPGRLVFYTSADGAASPSERARITAGGYFKASNNGAYRSSTGGYHELRQTANSEWTAIITCTSTSDPYGTFIEYTAAAPNNTGNAFFQCSDNAALRAQFRSNGGLANYQSNNVDLSDARTKTDITPAASMWDKVAALEIVTYKYIDQTHDDVNVGVIAQQVEAVEPVWVDADGYGETPEDGVPLKTVYTKDITFAAIKALQEAMARIEALEARIAVLEAGA